MGCCVLLGFKIGCFIRVYYRRAYHPGIICVSSLLVLKHLGITFCPTQCNLKPGGGSEMVDIQPHAPFFGSMTAQNGTACRERCCK